MKASIGDNDGDNDDPLPEGTEKVHAVRKELPVGIQGDEDWLDEFGFGEVDTRTVVFEPGEEIPLSVARRCWEAFSDSGLAAYNDSDELLNTVTLSDGSKRKGKNDVAKEVALHDLK